MITVAEVPADIPDYDRGEWKHWTDADRDCQDARQEVLIEESLEAVTFETEKECRVATGRWWAPYLAHHLGNPGHIDVDRHVPLKNAHLSGGWRWDAATKEAYANYLEDPDHLMRSVPGTTGPRVPGGLKSGSPQTKPHGASMPWPGQRSRIAGN